MGNSPTPLVIVDAANVVGSVPDGWWRDRVGATTRLRDRIGGLSEGGVPDEGVPEWAAHGPVEVLMVVEGKARGVKGTETVGVVPAAGSGDDTIVDLVAEAAPRKTLVITADRALRDRVMALGATITGPRSINRIGNN